MNVSTLSASDLGAQVKKWLVRVSLIIAGLLLGWLIMEAGLRLAAPILPQPIQEVVARIQPNLSLSLPERKPGASLFVGDPTYGRITLADKSNALRELAPGVQAHIITINWLNPQDRLAFRVDRADWQPRWPIDIVFVGDSFTFCYTEYTDCWVERLSKDHQLSTVNLGIPATGSISHRRVLETFGLPYEPRLVIWQWGGNDANDDYGLEIHQQRTVEPFILPPKQEKPPLSEWLSHNSIVYALADDFATQQAIRQANPIWFDPKTTQVGGVTMGIGMEYIRESYSLKLDRNRQGFALTKQAILQSQAELRKHNMDLVVVLMPVKEEVYRRWAEPVLGSQWIDEVEQGRLELMTFCKDIGLWCYDAEPLLQAHAEKGEILYYQDDWHPNPLGNQVMAEGVWDFLQQNNLLPNSSAGS